MFSQLLVIYLCSKYFNINCFHSIFFYFVFIENITDAESNGDSGKYLNDIVNNSNSSPELIEYYDVDDVSPDSIYPDPELAFNKNIAEYRSFDELNIPKTYQNDFEKSGTTKFNRLQEVSNPIDDIKEVKVLVNTDEPMTYTNDAHFKGKSIDFNIRHSMEELRNQDLRDHDIIDNIMYIYYGSNVALRKSLGGSIIIVGTVFALGAQILAIIFTLLRNR